jgi:hypothetical protein
MSPLLEKKKIAIKKEKIRKFEKQRPSTTKNGVIYRTERKENQENNKDMIISEDLQILNIPKTQRNPI